MVKIEKRKCLAEKILMLSPENEELVTKIVTEFLVAESARKLDVRPSKLKQVING
ncbi:hypothetical protein [Paraclostridium bifermentans]|uniref:hypothetical protein n=1 Tax=Paraclostridium bifermentans TaxID=1490 RepID=UPI001C7E25D5|nr:hypothetical protein [Paraclostridium bifermentans]GIM32994.1 hypothetical protein PAGU1678_22640 [Paraclostridium bifermentans subsp. muricolitidis]